ncbi:MAG: SDR family NAD(P)-dependent oxidoreductase, partial [Elusimicrobia bacterium]|nr:SDR family NAD(P)-dependent oxidoreductase [Elusimicrobiota bacterium]
MTDLLLKDKVIIVTGGSGLIGKNLIRAIIENGGIGIIADINEKASKDEINKIKSEFKDGKADYFKLDIVSEKSVTNMIKFVKKKYGKIDGVVNSAYPRNKHFGKGFEDTAYEDFCENINLQLGGYFLVSQQCGIFFRKQGYGNIINLSSIYGVIAPRFEIYGNAEFHGIKMGVPV